MDRTKTERIMFYDDAQKKFIVEDMKLNTDDSDTAEATGVPLDEAQNDTASFR